MKTYELSAPLSMEKIKQVNHKANWMPVNLVFKNTKGLTSESVRQLNNSVTISILGGLNPEKNKYNSPYYQNRTKYSPAELASILNVFETIERKIDPLWTDLEKAMFVYKSLCEYLTYSECKINGRDSARNLLGLLNGKSVCAGISMIIKEAMDRIGITCIYQNAQRFHSWNILKIDGKYYGIEGTIEVCSKLGNECHFNYFGYDDTDHFYSNYTHDISHEEEETEFELTEIPREVINREMKIITQKREQTIQVEDKGGFKIAQLNGHYLVVKDGIIYSGKYKGATYIRDDGSSFVVFPNSKNGKGVIEYSYLEYDENQNNITINKIYSEMPLILDEEWARDRVANLLLSKERIREKLGKYNGYVGYLDLYDGTKRYDPDFEEKVINKYRQR